MGRAVTRQQRAGLFLVAAMRQGRYAISGLSTCVTCGEVDVDEAGEREAFAVALDLGLTLGDGLARLDVDDKPGAFDVAIATAGVPFCDRCVPWILYAASVARRPPPECPCKAIPWLHSLCELHLVETIPQCAFAFGLVLGDDARRCDVCRALAKGRTFEEKRG